MVLTFDRVCEVGCVCLCRTGFYVPVHWVGRSVVCAGPACPICPVRSPRRSFFLGCWVARTRRVCEVPESFYRCLRAAALELGVTDLLGVGVVLRRGHVRDAWHCEERRLCEVAGTEIEELTVVRAVAALYRLPLPLGGENFWGWLERVQVDQADVLRAGALGMEADRRQEVGHYG